MEHVEGIEVSDIRKRLSIDDKKFIGKQLREITDRLNSSCEDFNGIHIKERALNNKRWDVFPDSFKKERLEYIKSLTLNDLIYVHGDLNADNILVDNENNVTLIDFADSVLAPKEYELPPLICEVFSFSRPYLEGFFENIDFEDISDKCLSGLLIHDFGANIIKDSIGRIEEIISFSKLKKMIIYLLKRNS